MAGGAVTIYRCPCGREGTHTHGQRFAPPITGRLTTAAGEFDIYGPMLTCPTWIAYPAGANRKERKRQDIKRRKAARKRRTRC